MKIIFALIWAGLFISSGCNKNDDPSTATDADFSVSGYEAAAPSTVSFINTSKNATSFFWSFGDGSTSTQSNPTHVYAVAGTYLLALKATGANGADSICKLLTIEAPPPSNKSAFSYFFNRCTGAPVGASFKTVNPASTNTVWDFGNGVLNISRDPVVQFLVPGDYTIKYSSQIGAVRDTVVRIIRIL